MILPHNSTPIKSLLSLNFILSFSKAFFITARVSLFLLAIESPTGSLLAISIANDGPETTHKFLDLIFLLKL